MRRTRSSSKRLSSEVIEPTEPLPSKKKKLVIKSDSESDVSYNSSDDENGKVKNYGIVENLNLSEDSDSECSENEGTGKPERKVTLTSPVPEQSTSSERIVEQNNSTVLSNLSDDSDADEKPVKSEYFDFTEILQSQKAASEFSQQTSPSKDVKTEPPPLEKEGKTKHVQENRGSKNQKTLKDKNKSLQKSKDTDQSKSSVCSDINSLSVAELLLIGENITNAKEVQQLKAEAPEERKRKDLEITIALPNLPSNSKKKKKDLKEILRLKLNAKRRETQVLMHKIHILVWIAHGNFLNTTLNSQDLLGVALSLIPSKHSYPPKHMDIDYLEKLTKFFRKKVPLNPDFVEEKSLHESLLKSFEKKETLNNKYLVYMFICVLRALGLQCRLVLNLVPVPLKPSAEDLLTQENMSGITNDSKKSATGTSKSASVATKPSKSNAPFPAKKVCDTKKTKKNEPEVKKSGRKNSAKGSKDTVGTIESPYFSSCENSPKKSSRSKSSSSQKELPSTKALVDKRGGKISHENPKHRSSSKKPYQSSVNKKSRSKKRSVNEASCSKDSDSLLVEEDFTSEDDSESETFSTPKKKKNRKVLSTDDEELEVPKKLKYKKPVNKGLDVWAEVFAEAEEKWLCVDVISTKIHVTQQIYNGATHPVAYVLAWNSDQTIKDVTRRYVINFVSASKKNRVEQEWIERTLRPYRCTRTIRDKEEDEDLDRLMYDQPKPLSIAEYKNHPLYVLKRHLLKFEAIYPPDAPPLGYIKKEPIYARECVKDLHSRETWLKEAKLVRLNETPYKIVKARPKYDKLSGTVKTDIPLELFGDWQTEEYMPPIAKDGIVPRNAYGNVDLYKRCMLPIGTVYLELPGVYRVARKLNIDCAAAVTGFDFHSGGSHPVIGGYVVCEEFKDIILDAWNEEVDNASKREEEKRLARIYKNWRRLIKGALILNRVKLRYMRDED